MRITVVYNNVQYAPEMKTAWGFATVIETGRETVLFDTGGDGPTLLANMERLGLMPEHVNAVVLSHTHADHIGGLDDFLARNARVTVYMPQSFPVTFRDAVKRRGAQIDTVGGGPRWLFANFHSTGEMGNGVKEQALIIDTPSGLVVVTGCAHPGIVEVVRTARGYLNKEVYLVMGGFHLSALSEAEIRQKIRSLASLGTKKVAPSHCTGDAAIALFRKALGNDFVDGGCGAVIELS